MCGRKPVTPGERRIHLLGSSALSRDHAEFVVSERISVGGRMVLELSVIDKRSKFGTYVNGDERLVADKSYPVRVNDVISFGTVGNSCKVRVEEFPVIICSSRMHSTADKQAFNDARKALGASTCKSIMDRGVTHLVVNNKMVPTMKLILAAARGIPIVTVGYLQSLAGILGNDDGNIRNLNDPLPSTSEYAPILFGSGKKKESLNDLHNIIEAAGGKAIIVPEAAKDLICFLSKHPWRRPEYRRREPVWMPTERQFHLHNSGGEEESEFSALFNVVWPSGGGAVKLTDKQKLLYTILTQCDFIVTSMEHLYCGISPPGSIVNDGDQTERVSFGGRSTNLNRSNGNPVTSSGQPPPVKEEELTLVSKSRDVGRPTTSPSHPTLSTLDHERGSSCAAPLHEELVFDSAKPKSQQSSSLNTLNVTEKENNAVKRRKRRLVADESVVKDDAAKGSVPTSLFGSMSENSSTIITKQLNVCNMPPPPQMPDRSGWVQFLHCNDKKERPNALRQEADKESVVEQGETLSPADTKYVKLILSEEERVAIAKKLDRNHEATKYGAGGTCFRKNSVPPPPSNPVSMGMLIEMAPAATDKDLELQREADRLEEEARRDEEHNSSELFNKKRLVAF